MRVQSRDVTCFDCKVLLPTHKNEQLCSLCRQISCLPCYKRFHLHSAATDFCYLQRLSSPNREIVAREPHANVEQSEVSALFDDTFADTFFTQTEYDTNGEHKCSLAASLHSQLSLSEHLTEESQTRMMSFAAQERTESIAYASKYDQSIIHSKENAFSHVKTTQKSSEIPKKMTSKSDAITEMKVNRTGFRHALKRFFKNNSHEKRNASMKTSHNNTNPTRTEPIQEVVTVSAAVTEPFQRQTYEEIGELNVTNTYERKESQVNSALGAVRAQLRRNNTFDDLFTSPRDTLSLGQMYYDANSLCSADGNGTNTQRQSLSEDDSKRITRIPSPNDIHFEDQRQHSYTKDTTESGISFNSNKHLANKIMHLESELASLRMMFERNQLESQRNDSDSNYCRHCSQVIPSHSRNTPVSSPSSALRSAAYENLFASEGEASDGEMDQRQSVLLQDFQESKEFGGSKELEESKPFEKSKESNELFSLQKDVNVERFYENDSSEAEAANESSSFSESHEKDWNVHEDTIRHDERTKFLDPTKQSSLSNAEEIETAPYWEETDRALFSSLTQSPKDHSAFDIEFVSAQQQWFSSSTHTLKELQLTSNETAKGSDSESKEIVAQLSDNITTANPQPSDETQKEKVRLKKTKSKTKPRKPNVRSRPLRRRQPIPTASTSFNDTP